VRLRAVPAAAVMLGVLAGCATVRLEDGTYLVAQKGYRVGAPAGWARIPSDADLALRRADLGAGLMAHATCAGRAPSRPLPVLVRHLRFGLRDVRDLEETPVSLGGLPGTASRFRATLDGVPVAVEAMTLTGPGCVYDLIGVAPPETIGVASSDFARFTERFAVVGEPRR
jgi:hypothetical protein